MRSLTLPLGEVIVDFKIAEISMTGWALINEANSGRHTI
jgi:hypothetical protein